VRLEGRRSDAIAVGFVAYGVGALLLLLATLGLVLAALAAVESTARSIDAASGPALDGRLERVESSLSEAEAAIRGFDATLESTASSARDGRELGTSLAASLRRLATALDVTVLGTQPFAGVGTEFAATADRADALATDLETTAGSLDANRASLARLADEVDGLSGELAALRRELAAGDAGDGSTTQGRPFGLDASSALALARLVVVAMLAWLAVPAVLMILLGRRRWRSGRLGRFGGDAPAT